MGQGPPSSSSTGTVLFERAISAEETDHTGKWMVNIKWNGSATLIIGCNVVSWKGTHATFESGDAKWSINSDGSARLTCRFFVPWQTSAWTRQVGLDERLELTFQNKAASGSFRRTGEGGLPASANWIGRDSSAGPRLRTALQNDRVNQEEMCPICFDEFDTAEVRKVLTPCQHAFCIRCVVSALAIRPPTNQGACPLCRKQTHVGDLYYEHNKQFVMQ